FQFTHKGGWVASEKKPDPKSSDSKSSASKSSDPKSSASKSSDSKSSDPKSSDSSSKSEGGYAKVVEIKADSFNLANGGVVASPDGKLIAMTTGDFQNHEMSIIDVETKKPTKRWKVPTVVQALAWSADGSTLAGIMLGDSTRKSQILVWDTKTWEQRATFDHPGYP